MRHGGGRSGLLLRDLAYACCLWTGVYVSALYLLEHAFWVRRSDLAYDTLWNFHYLVSVPSTASDAPPVFDIRHMESDIRVAGRPINFHYYPGAGHWFFEEGRPPFA